MSLYQLLLFGKGFFNYSIFSSFGGKILILGSLNVKKEVIEEDEFENTEQVRKMFKEYVTALSGDNKEREMVEEEISEEEFDSLPCSDTKH